MKRIIACALTLLALTAGLHAQAQDPQLAMPMLTEYFQARERGERTGGIVLTSIGSVLLAAGAAGAVWSFNADPADFSAPDELMGYRAASIAGAGGGALLAGIGLTQLARPAGRYLSQYAYLYAETDPVVQEARAYAIMKDLAEAARRERISGAIMNLCTPLVSIGINVAVCAFTEDWDNLGDTILSSTAWTVPSMIGGILSLASGKSAEERMLDTYRTTSATYRAGGQRP